MFKSIKLRTVFSIIFASILTGCATHGEVNIPVKSAIDNPDFRGKSFSTDIWYSQPEPGIFTLGKQLELKPIENAEVSVASSRVLSRFNELFMQQLPLETHVVNNESSDYQFTIELYAHDKFGPAYTDYELLLNVGKGLISLGLGSDEYTIIADFDVNYILRNANGDVIHAQSFSVNDEIDHEQGAFDSYDIGEDLAAKLLEKHIVLTMHDFFNATVNKSKTVI